MTRRKVEVMSLGHWRATTMSLWGPEGARTGWGDGGSWQTAHSLLTKCLTTGHQDPHAVEGFSLL